jgi:hypothetical protein
MRVDVKEVPEVQKVQKVTELYKPFINGIKAGYIFCS